MSQCYARKETARTCRTRVRDSGTLRTFRSAVLYPVTAPNHVESIRRRAFEDQTRRSSMMSRLTNVGGPSARAAVFSASAAVSGRAEFFMASS